MLNTLLMASLLTGNQTKVAKPYTHSYRNVVTDSQGCDHIGQNTNLDHRVRKGIDFRSNDNDGKDPSRICKVGRHLW
jgi:hypothetical protein